MSFLRLIKLTYNQIMLPNSFQCYYLRFLNKLSHKIFPPSSVHENRHKRPVHCLEFAFVVLYACVSREINSDYIHIRSRWIIYKIFIRMNLYRVGNTSHVVSSCLYRGSVRYGQPLLSEVEVYFLI